MKGYQKNPQQTIPLMFKLVASMRPIHDSFSRRISIPVKYDSALSVVHLCHDIYGLFCTTIARPVDGAPVSTDVAN